MPLIPRRQDTGMSRFLEESRRSKRLSVFFLRYRLARIIRSFVQHKDVIEVRSCRAIRKEPRKSRAKKAAKAGQKHQSKVKEHRQPARKPIEQTVFSSSCRDPGALERSSLENLHHTVDRRVPPQQKELISFETRCHEPVYCFRGSANFVVRSNDTVMA